MSAAVTTTVENALVAWALAGSGLAAGQVVWADQPGAKRPEGQYIALNPIALVAQGHDWLEVEENEESTGDDGEEIRHVGRGVRQLTLSLQCFGGAGTGVASAQALLEQLRAKSVLPTPADLLLAGGLGLAEFGSVRRVGSVINTATFEPRAVAEARFHLASEVSELGTYIETVLVEGEVH